MLDPVSEIVNLLQPQTPFSKRIDGAGLWGLRRDMVDRPYYAIVLEGRCSLAVDDRSPVVLEEGDFVLIPSAGSFMLNALDASAETVDETETVLTPFHCQQGDRDGVVNARLLSGYCSFASPDADVLLALLPNMVHVRDDARLSVLVKLVAEEVEIERPARDVVLGHLLELLFLEALRSSASIAGGANLLRGLADERLAGALRSMHESPWQKWTVAGLARVAALSRSAFFERFQKVVGMPPMEYLVAWRMALAKQYLEDKSASLGEIAEKLGYSNANSFSIAFKRRFGVPPSRYGGTVLERAN